MKLLDFKNNVAGPGAGALLSGYGAEVIKIERPIFGDDTRTWRSREFDSTGRPGWTRGHQKVGGHADVVLQALTPELRRDSVWTMNP
ncbi:CoA transferase [Mesorhizobium sp. M0771]|uniref:CoA transferase n=1 Tax=Mesorhizobium sp. M0771 TaxID=2956997 RepID=UPI00333A427B